MTVATDEGSFERALSAIVSEVRPVAVRFEEAGHHLYLVGGVVRDLLLGVHGPGDDIDLTTDARPEVIEALIDPLASAVWTQGRRFGTIGALVSGRDLEITTHRSESYDVGSRKPDVIFGDDLTTDLSRRDFTINAMAVSVIDQALHDPFGGYPDLRQRMLRTPIDPVVSFTDDPLRMLRAARFLPRFGLSIEPSVAEAVRTIRDRLAIVSAERIHDELERLLALDEPGLGLAFLAESGLLRTVIPALERRDLTNAVAAGAEGGTPLARRAGLLSTLTPTQAERWLETLRYSTADRTDTLRVLDAVGRLEDVAPSAGVVRRLVDLVGADLVDVVLDVARTTRAQRSTPIDVDALARIHAQLAAEEDLGDFRPPLTGRQIIDHLGVEPGPLVGEAMAMLRERRLETGHMSATDARAALDTWYASRLC